MQDLCVRILWTTCIRILQEHLYKIPVMRTLVQDLCIRPFGPLVSGSCGTTFARSLYEDTFKRLVSGSFSTTCARSVLGSLYEDPFGPLVSESCSRTCARSLLQAPFDYLYLSVQDFLWTTCIILEEHLRKISISGSFRPLLRGSCKTTCARSLYQGPLDHCVRTLYDHLCKISVSGSCWTTVSGSGWTTCARSVLGSLCEDPLDHLYLSVQDFLWTTCIILEEHLRKISISGSFRPLLRGSCKTTCARSLFQDPYPFGPLISIL